RMHIPEPCRGVTMRALSNDETSYHRRSMKHREIKKHHDQIVPVHNCIITSRNRDPAFSPPWPAPQTQPWRLSHGKKRTHIPEPCRGVTRRALSNDETSYHR